MWRKRQPPVVDIPGLLADFKDFLIVDRQLTTRTVKSHLRQIKRLLETVGSDPKNVTREALREYLKVFNDRPANTYRNVLKSLRVFFEFLGRPELVSSFKFPPKATRVVKVTSTEDMRSFYNEMNELRAKAMFLMYATSGMRRDELLDLKRKDIDLAMRMIIPSGNCNRTKRTYVTFYNEEAAEVLKDILPKDPEAKIFPVSEHYFRKMTKRICDKIGVHLTPQLLREWFCSEMGELGVPDRYIDAFCGRGPRSILARHYTDYSPERLKQIYDKANLKVLAQYA